MALPESPEARPAPRRRRSFTTATVLLVALALPPLLLTTHIWPPTAVVPGRLGEDYGIFTWNLRQMTESMLALRNPFVTTDLYYPLGARLTKHSYAVGLFPVGIAAKLLTGGASTYPIAAMRLARALCLVAGLVLAFLALRSLGANPWASLVASTGWVYSVFFAQHIVHLHILPGVFILPAVTLATLRLVRRPSPANAALVSLAVALSAYFSEFSVFALLALSVASALALARPAGRALLWAVSRGVGPRGALWAALVFLLATSPILLNWSADDGSPARVRAAHSFRAWPSGFVVPDPYQTPLYMWRATPFDLARWESSYRYEVLVFLGYPLLLLGMVAAVALRRTHSIWTGLGLVFLAFSLGPYARLYGTLVPLPYWFLTKIPPFPMLRTPNRLAAVALWALTCLAALGLTWLMSVITRRRSQRSAVALAALMMLWVVLEGYRPGPPVAPPQVPSALARLVPGPVVNVPIGFMDGFAMYLQTWHGRALLTGYVSRRTPEQLAHVRALRAALEHGPSAFAYTLRALGTRNVILGPGVDDALGPALSAQGLVVIDLRHLR
jgi:hypothetical protein